MFNKITRKLITYFPGSSSKYLTPNKYAQTTDVTIEDDLVNITGYQQFQIDLKQNTLRPTGVNSQQKFNILNYFLKVNIQNASFMDIGCNNGMFVFMAYLFGASESRGYDIDTQYLKTAEAVKSKLDAGNVFFEERNLENIQGAFDFVLFLSMIHWVYNKTSLYGSLDAVIQHLASITNRCLIIEWVSEQDHKVQRDKHITYNKGVIKEPYDQIHFEKALNNHFTSVELLGINTPTRTVYAAWK